VHLVLGTILLNKVSSRIPILLVILLVPFLLTAFWDVAPCRSYVNQRFGGRYRFQFQGRKNPRARNQREQLAATGATSQKTAFFIITALKTSDLT
jgi:hypothetical protein